MKRVAIILLVTVLMIFLYGQISYTVAPYKNWDLATYRNIAATAPAIPSDNCQPHAYRLLGPYLVGLLPVNDVVGFYAFSVLASIGLVFLLYYFLCTLGLSPFVSSLAVVLYTLNRFWFGSTVWDFFQINDLLSQIWIILLFLALMRRRWLIFGLVLFVGVLTRETSLLMLPVALVYLLERRELRRAWLRLLAAAAPALAAFALIRLLVPVHCGMGLLSQFVTHADTIFSPEKIFRLTVYSYLPLSLLPWIFFSTTRQFFRSRLYMLLFVGLVFIMPLFAPGFDERLMAPAFVVVYALLGFIIQDHVQKKRWFLAVLIGAAFLASLHHTTARFPLPDRTWTLVLSIGALAAVTVAGITVRLSERRPPETAISPK